MRGSTFVILAAMIIIGLLIYFYLLPKFKPAEEQSGDAKKDSVSVFEQRRRAMEAEVDEEGGA